VGPSGCSAGDSYAGPQIDGRREADELAASADHEQAGRALRDLEIDQPAKGRLVEFVGRREGRDLGPGALGFGRVVLSGGESVLGFLAQGSAPDGAQDVTAHGGWREYLEAVVKEREGWKDLYRASREVSS